MTPLDLRRHPPRSSRVEIGGIGYLARAIDKVRAELPDGNLGDYLVLSDEITTMSAMFYRRIGVSHEDFKAAVERAENDDDVAAWLREHVAEERIKEWNGRLFGMRLADIPLELRSRVLATHASAGPVPDETFLVDLFDADDKATFAAKS
jgi:hypothetical protein